ncbi:MAG: fluoride efflux transporter CrcB [Chloroflexi bacterium]|nr:fluoride efflux transporter CrcB [Chloroflexota bacterium]
MPTLRSLHRAIARAASPRYNPLHRLSVWVDVRGVWRVQTFLLIGVGAFFGANARYWIGVMLRELFGTTFPLGTLFVNVTGSLLLAVFVAWAARQSALALPVRSMIAVGFFGAYTTFSSFATESIALIEAQRWGAFLINLLGTNLLCLAGAALGIVVGSRL